MRMGVYEATQYHANMAKVAAAFKAIRAEGVFARQNFMCCQTCACAALNEQIVNSRGKGKTIKGAVYYHRQDAESALQWGALYIGFGAGGDNENEDCIAVGQIVVKHLRAAGLDVQWGGTVWDRPVVTIWRTAERQEQFDRDGIMLPDCV